MNKRARMRLIGVTAIILIVVAAILFSTGSSAAAYETITQVTKGSAKVGDRVKVGGAVVTGSWNKQSNPMVFTIREETDSVGQRPDPQGHLHRRGSEHLRRRCRRDRDRHAGQGGVVQANEMITKCPSKYESAVGAIPVAELFARPVDGRQGRHPGDGLRQAGFAGPVTAAQRFYLTEKADGTGRTVAVKFSGALPDTIKDGVQVVVTGTLESSDAFTATAVSLSQGQK